MIFHNYYDSMYPVKIAIRSYMKLLNKKVLVTGAYRSIGKAIALAFAKEEADVVISYRSNQESALQVVEEIEDLGRRSQAIYADFTDKEQVYKLFEKALEFLGTIDILVNNAAGWNTVHFLELSVDEFESLHQVGVVAPFLLTQLVAKHMIEKQNPGCILNISTISSLRPYPCRVAHSCAKASLNMLTQATALELAPHGIRVNALAPGFTPYDEAYGERKIASIPLQRAGTPEDQAQAAVFLASSEASWITGQVFTIDGGQSLPLSS